MPVIQPRDPEDEPVVTTFRLLPVLTDSLDFIAEVGEAESSFSRNEVAVQILDRGVAEYVREKPQLRAEYDAFLARRRKDRSVKREAEKKKGRR